MCDIDSKVILSIWNLCFILHIIRNYFAIYELPEKMKEESSSQNTGKFLVYATLTFDFKVIKLISNFRSNLHTLDSHCVK